MKKVVLVGSILLIIVLLIVFVYFLFSKEKINIVEERELTAPEGSGITSSKVYLLEYTHGSAKEYFQLTKNVFLNQSEAENYLNTILLATEDSIYNKTMVQVGSATGYVVNRILAGTTPRVEGLTLIVNYRNVLISCDGYDINDLIKVVEWFIENY